MRWSFSSSYCSDAPRMVPDLCHPAGWWTFWIGLLGLSLDLLAASIIVSTDISWFDRFWEDDARMQEAQRLRRGRRRLFGDGTLERSDTGFEAVRDEIRRRSDVDEAFAVSLFLEHGRC